MTLPWHGKAQGVGDTTAENDDQNRSSGLQQRVSGSGGPERVSGGGGGLLPIAHPVGRVTGFLRICGNADSTNAGGTGVRLSSTENQKSPPQKWVKLPARRSSEKRWTGLVPPEAPEVDWVAEEKRAQRAARAAQKAANQGARGRSGVGRPAERPRGRIFG